ncbi:endolytic transglycosylase MltG [Ekhidna sp. MALMAid0563]|uniref:endolytic transglycosylase MltG n=1 Tax=Ekhidna sp. MALMAid0563 TaxID=3143937 RepID=UPI0032DF55D4
MRKKYFIAIFLVVFTMMLSSFAFYTYQILYTPNVLIEQDDRYFAIPKGTTFKQLQNKLAEERIVNDLVSFSFLAKLKDLDTNVKNGMYLIKGDMTNIELINLLRSGSQTPIQLTFSNARLLKQLPKILTNSLEIDSADLAPILLADTTAAHYGFTEETFISMFIPNTYEVYWTITPKGLLDRMKMEYERFWTDERKQKAANLGMSQSEVATLASIVQGETNKMDEAPTIAGVYINRLKRGIPLQADPTLVFAIGDFSIRRILNKDKEFDSPYNTYKYRGLPPGPINLPGIPALNAVLNYEDHNYLYFCAKADFSGYHVFARTLSEHNVNARKFQRALNRERIYR